MNRFFISKPEIHNKQIILPSDVSHQVKNVLRMKSGDRIAILDNQDHEWLIELNVISEKITGMVLDQDMPTLEPGNKLTLIFSLTQRAKVELILQKCTEIGVSAFLPFVSKRSIVRSVEDVETKRGRWEKIIQEAAEQSTRGHIPELQPAVSFEKAVKDYGQYDIPLLAWENENQTRMNSFLVDKSKIRIGLMIGPEGGFEENEVRTAIKFNWIPVSLGKRILRMETAAIVGTALVLNLCED